MRTCNLRWAVSGRGGGRRGEAVLWQLEGLLAHVLQGVARPQSGAPLGSTWVQFCHVCPPPMHMPPDERPPRVTGTLRIGAFFSEPIAPPSMEPHARPGAPGPSLGGGVAGRSAAAAGRPPCPAAGRPGRGSAGGRRGAVGGRAGSRAVACRMVPFPAPCTPAPAGRRCRHRRKVHHRGVGLPVLDAHDNPVCFA